MKFRNRRNTFSFFAHGCLTAVFCASITQAADYSWTGNSAGTQDWTTGSNWSGGAVFSGPGTNTDTLTFFTETTTALASGNNVITTSVPSLTLNRLTLNGRGAAATGATNITIGTSASTWTLGGTSTTVNLNGLTVNQSLNYNIASNLALAANTTFAGTGSASFNFSGLISGSGQLNKNSGTSNLKLSGSNTFTGSVTISAGTLTVTNSSSLGSGNKSIFLSNGGTLAMDNTGIGADIALGSNFAFPNTIAGATIRNVAGNNSVAAGVITTTNATSFFLRSDGGFLSMLGTIGMSTYTNGRVLQFTGAGSGSVYGNISDNGVTNGILAIQKHDAGTWLLSGFNTQRGSVSVNGGTLVARSGSALGTGAVSVANGANLSYAAVTDTPLNLGSTLAITGGTTTIGGSIGSTATSARINVAGNATTTAAAVKVNVFGISGVTPLSGTNDYTLITGGGTTNTLNNATYTLSTVYNNTNFTVGALLKSATALQVSVTSQTALTEAYWKGGLTGATNIWAASNGSSQSNWTATSEGADQALIPGSGADVIISNPSVTTAPTATFLGAAMTIKSLTIADTTNGLGLGADGYTLTISPASSSSGITVNSGVPASTIASRVNLSNAQTWINDSANDLTVSGVVLGSGDLTKSGPGRLVLSGVNTNTGTTSIDQGILRLSNQFAAQSSPVVMNGGSLEFDQSVSGKAFTLGGLSSTSAGTGYDIALQNNSGIPVAIALTVGGNNANTTYSGVLSGAGSLTKTGTGALTLSGSNTFAGGVTLSAGQLNVNNANALGAGTLTISGGTIDNTAGGALTLATNNPQNWNGDFTFAGSKDLNLGTGAVTLSNNRSVTVSGGNLALGGNLSAATLTLTKLGTGTLTLGGATSLKTLNINANSIVDIGEGTLTVANGGASTIQSTTGGTINATGGGSIVLGSNSADIGTAGGTTLTINVPITGSAANQFEIYNSGAGTVVLTNTNTFAGNVLVSTGILSVAKIGNQGSTTSALGSGTTITLGNGATTAQIKYTGTGETTDRILNFNNGASGMSIDQSGTGLLKFAGGVSGATSGNGTKTLTLQGSTDGTGEISGIIGNGSAGTQAITKAGTGTWTLSGSNTYTGTTTVSGGSLIINGNQTAANGAVSVTSATLGGIGTSGASVSIGAQAVLSPGDGGIGTLTTGSASFATGSTLAVDINTNTGTCDLLNVNGSVAATGTVNLVITDIGSNAQLPAGTKLVLASYTGSWSDSHVLTFNGVPVANESTIILGANTFTVDYSDATLAGKAMTLTVAGGSPYDTWADSFSLTGGNRSPSADPDGDGLSNLTEFAFGTNPSTGSSGALEYVAGGSVTKPGTPIALNLATGEGVDFRAIFCRRKDFTASGLVYNVQFSADLSNWVNNEEPPTVLTGEESTGDVEAVSVPYPLFITTLNGTEKPKFFRVGVDTE